MTTAYTQAELEDFEELFEKRLPRVPVEKDLKKLPMVTALVCAGAPTGILFRLLMAAGDTALIFLNPVVALQLYDLIMLCAEDSGWWKSEAPREPGPPLALPTSAEARTANEILSLTTASAGEIMLAHLARRGGGKQFIGLPRGLATEVFLTLKTAGEKFLWWDAEFNLLPSDGASARITDKEIWTAAQQLIGQNFPDPEIEASQRADAAYELGDMFNFGLWGRVANAVKELVRRGPESPKDLH